MTRDIFRGGELRTGDLGFLHEEDLYVSGRLDDMICVGGRNVFAHDLEAELIKASSIRPGCCAIVDISREGRTVLVLLAEATGAQSSLNRLAYRLNRVARQMAAVRIREYHFLPRGLLPKTPSGKVHRFRCRQQALDPPTGTWTVIL